VRPTPDKPYLTSLGIWSEDELPIVLASTPLYGRMPASVMAGDHGFDSTDKFLSELVFGRL
jgi:hypothetical protein